MRKAAAICPHPLWPFDLESGVLSHVGYLCANFSLPRPLCSRLRSSVDLSEKNPFFADCWYKTFYSPDAIPVAQPTVWKHWITETVSLIQYLWPILIFEVKVQFSINCLHKMCEDCAKSDCVKSLSFQWNKLTDTCHISLLDDGTVLFLANYVYTYSLYVSTMIFIYWSALTDRLNFAMVPQNESPCLWITFTSGYRNLWKKVSIVVSGQWWHLLMGSATMVEVCGLPSVAVVVNF